MTTPKPISWIHSGEGTERVFCAARPSADPSALAISERACAPDTILDLFADHMVRCLRIPAHYQNLAIQRGATTCSINAQHSGMTKSYECDKSPHIIPVQKGHAT